MNKSKLMLFILLFSCVICIYPQNTNDERIYELLGMIDKRDFMFFFCLTESDAELVRADTKSNILHLIIEQMKYNMFGPNIKDLRLGLLIDKYQNFEDQYFELVLQYLLEKGININDIDIYGCTALHYAVLMNNEFFVKLLLYNKAAKNIKNKNGKLPMDIALERGNKIIIDLLK